MSTDCGEGIPPFLRGEFRRVSGSELEPSSIAPALNIREIPSLARRSRPQIEDEPVEPKRDIRGTFLTDEPIGQPSPFRIGAEAPWWVRAAIAVAELRRFAHAGRGAVVVLRSAKPENAVDVGRIEFLAELP